MIQSGLTLSIDNMKHILTILLVTFALTASAQKSRDDFWTAENRYDTIPVTLVDAKGKESKALAIYQHGKNIAGKDQPKLIGYLSTSKRRMTAGARKIKWSKM